MVGNVEAQLQARVPYFPNFFLNKLIASSIFALSLSGCFE
jgi:hypothetical protein